jgi:hypothetical protein
MARGRSAKVICRRKCFWITPRQFWDLIRQGTITYVSEPPLTGEYRGCEEDFLITKDHVILNSACPEHTYSFLKAREQIRSR